jgi:hypothetical protein
MPEFISMHEFARREGCAITQVQRGLAYGTLHRTEAGLDAAQVRSGWRKQNRRTLGRSLPPVETVAASSPAPGTAGYQAGAEYAAVVLKKERSLACLRALEYERRANALVSRELAQQLLLELSQAARDAWSRWPARVGASMAGELDVDAAVLTRLLTQHVLAHLAELGEPQVDFESPRTKS